MTTVIAEIGSNWKKYENQDLNWVTLRKQIELAKECGADAVKFQLFTAEEIYGPKVRSTRFAQDFDRFALPWEWIPDISALCGNWEIEFMCSALSVDGYKFLEPYVERHKLASPEATDFEITKYLMAQPKQVIYSDGCTNRLAFGRCTDVRLHCVSNYPATVADYDLVLKSEGEWGVSDHTLTDDLAIMSRRLGATYFEKHVDFCSSEGGDTPDTVVSIGKENFTRYARVITNYDPEMTHKIKENCGKSYARVQTKDGWFRPIPDGADLNITCLNTVSGKLQP